MRFNGLKSHLRLQKLRFLDAPGLFLLEIVLPGAYDLADVLANVLVLKWMIGALMGRDLIRAAWVLGGFLVYQLSVSFLWHWYFERVYPQWKERLEYKLNCRLYRIMLDADCRKYNEESYFHGYRRALQFTQTKMEETLEFYRQLFGSFLAGAVAVVIYMRMDPMIVVFVLLAFVASRFCVKSLVEKTNAKRDEQNKKDALHQNYLRIFLRKDQYRFKIHLTRFLQIHLIFSNAYNNTIYTIAQHLNKFKEILNPYKTSGILCTILMVSKR